MIQHTLTQLKSGLTVIQVPMKSLQSATVLALCNTGSRYENDKQFGIAHFFEHMVFKGTKNYPNAQALASAIDAVGANFNAFTSKEYTGYYVQAAAKHVDLALDVVSDMLLTPKLRQEDIDREKGVIVEELNMYADSPPRHIGNLFEQMVFDGTGLSHDIIGLKDTVRSLTSQDFQNFLSQWYGLGNMIVIVAGDANVVEGQAMLDKIEKHFSKNPAHQRQGKIDTQKLVEKKPLSDKKFHLEFRQTEQAHFVMSWPGLERANKKRFALSLLGTILGGNMSSRLFTEVREKRGLCYYVNSDVDYYRDVGLFGATAGVDPARVEEAIKVTINEFKEVAGKGDHQRQITKQELKRAKDYIAGKLVLGLEDSQSVAQFFGMKQLLLGEIQSPTQVLEKYKKVTLEEVNDLAQDLVQPSQLRFALIGPFKDEKASAIQSVAQEW